MNLYAAPLSLFARKVEIALGEKGLAFERVMVPFSQTRGYDPKHPGVLAANPKGQVPVLVDGDLTLFDSTVIIEYLEDAYPLPALYPQAAAERARCRMLELFADEIMLVPLRGLMHRTEPPGADAERRASLETRTEAAEAEIAAQHAELDWRIGSNSYLCGAFSAADIGVFMSTFYGIRLGGPSIRTLPALSAWYDRIAERPVVAAIVAEIDAADLELSHPVPRR
jgi:glutathione S-transferase